MRPRSNMAAWSEDNGFTAVAVSEHHATGDGYLPSPIVLASAYRRRRTKQIAISVAALLVPASTTRSSWPRTSPCSITSAGAGSRTSPASGTGRPSTNRSVGSFGSRGPRHREPRSRCCEKRGQGSRFEHEGPSGAGVAHAVLAAAIHCCVTAAGPRAAARRAGSPSTCRSFPQLRSAPPDRRVRTGTRTARASRPVFVISPGTGPLNVFVSEDPDRTWSQIGGAPAPRCPQLRAVADRRGASTRSRSTTRDDD